MYKQKLSDKANQNSHELCDLALSYLCSPNANNRKKYQEHMQTLEKTGYVGRYGLMAYDAYFGIFQPRNPSQAWQHLATIHAHNNATAHIVRTHMLNYYCKTYGKTLYQALNEKVKDNETSQFLAYAIGLSYLNGLAKVTDEQAEACFAKAVRTSCELAKSANRKSQLSSFDNLVSLCKNKDYWAMQVLTLIYESGSIEKNKIENAIIEMCEILNAIIKEEVSQEADYSIRFITKAIFNVLLIHHKNTGNHNKKIAGAVAKLMLFIAEIDKKNMNIRVFLALGEGYGIGFKENKTNTTKKLIALANSLELNAQEMLADWQLSQGNLVHAISLLQILDDGGMLDDGRKQSYQQILKEQENNAELQYRLAQMSIVNIGSDDMDYFHEKVTKLYALQDERVNFLIAYAFLQKWYTEQHPGQCFVALKAIAATGYKPAKIFLAESLLGTSQIKENPEDLALLINLLTELKDESAIVKYLCIHANKRGILKFSQAEIQAFWEQATEAGYSLAQHDLGYFYLREYQKSFLTNQTKNNEIKTKAIDLLDRSFKFHQINKENTVLTSNEKLDEFILLRERHNINLFPHLVDIANTFYQTKDYGVALKYLQMAIDNQDVNQESKNQAHNLMKKINAIPKLTALIAKQIADLRSKNPGELAKFDFTIHDDEEIKWFTLKISLSNACVEKSPGMVNKIKLPSLQSQIVISDDHILLERINISWYMDNLTNIQALLNEVVKNTKKTARKSKVADFSDDAYIQSLNPEKDKYDEMVKKYQRNLDKLHRLDAAVLEHYQDIRELKEHMSNTMTKKKPFSFIDVISQENEKIHKAIKLFEGITTKVYLYSGSDVNQDFSLKLKEIEEAYHLSHAGYIAISAVVNSFIVEREFNKLKKNFIPVQEEKTKNIENEPPPVVSDTIVVSVKAVKKCKIKKNDPHSEEVNELMKEVKTLPKDSRTKLLKWQERLCKGEPLAIIAVSKILISNKKELEYFPLYEDFERVYLVREDEKEAAKQCVSLGLTLKTPEIRYQINKFIERLPKENTEPVAPSFQCKK